MSSATTSTSYIYICMYIYIYIHIYICIYIYIYKYILWSEFASLETEHATQVYLYVRAIEGAPEERFEGARKGACCQS